MLLCTVTHYSQPPVSRIKPRTSQLQEEWCLLNCVWCYQWFVVDVMNKTDILTWKYTSFLIFYLFVYLWFI